MNIQKLNPIIIFFNRLKMDRKNIRNKNEINIILENIQIKNENCLLNDNHFLFDDKKGISTINLFSNFENITSNENENNDEEDKKEEKIFLKEILGNLNMNENEIKQKKACQEIRNILKRPIIDNEIRFPPFKPLLKPKKISMEGRVLYNVFNCNSSN